jgi:hypothetical protein
MRRRLLLGIGCLWLVWVVFLWGRGGSERSGGAGEGETDADAAGSEAGGQGGSDASSAVDAAPRRRLGGALRGKKGGETASSVIAAAMRLLDNHKGNRTGKSKPLPPWIRGRIVGQDFASAHRLIGGRDNFPPVPDESPQHPRKRVQVAIVGGGMAGLSAAWRLQGGGFGPVPLPEPEAGEGPRAKERRRAREAANKKAQHLAGKHKHRTLRMGRDVVVLELEPEVGGNAGSFENEVGAFPRAGHYIIPATSQCREWRRLLHDIDVIKEFDKNGEPEYDERFWVRKPDERVFVDGKWESEFPPFRTRGEKNIKTAWERYMYGGSRRKDGCGLGDGKENLDLAQKKGGSFSGGEEGGNTFASSRAASVGLQQLRDEHGQPAFSIPLDRSSRSDRFAPLRAFDNTSVAKYMDSESIRGLFSSLARISGTELSVSELSSIVGDDQTARAKFSDSARLKWLVDYYMKDEFGSDSASTSAWSAMHYWAARDCGDEYLTWPEGNGHISKKLSHFLGRSKSLRTSALVFAVSAASRDGNLLTDAQARASPDHWYAIDYFDSVTKTSKRIVSRFVIYSAPRFTAPFVIDGYRQYRDAFVRDFTYSPWMTAFITLKEQPKELGDMCWDNVFYESLGVGYVVSTHQNLGPSHSGRSVWTYYRPLAEEGENVKRARARLIATSWKDWVAEILADLGQAHPGIEKLVTNVDVWLMGHAMIRPKPGFVWGDSRRAATEEHRRFPATNGRIVFGHSDMSGIPIIEEANYWGVRAADTVLAEI